MSTPPHCTNPNASPDVLRHFPQPHSSCFFAVPGCPIQHLHKLQYSTLNGCQSRMCGHMPGNCGAWMSAIPIVFLLCVGTIAQNHSGISYLWDLCLSQMAEIGQRVQKWLKGGGNSRQTHSMITQALGNLAKKGKSWQLSQLHWAEFQSQYMFASKCESYLTAEYPSFFPFSYGMKTCWC